MYRFILMFILCGLIVGCVKKHTTDSLKPLFSYWYSPTYAPLYMDLTQGNINGASFTADLRSTQYVACRCTTTFAGNASEGLFTMTSCTFNPDGNYPDTDPGCANEVGTYHYTGVLELCFTTTSPTVCQNYY